MQGPALRREFRGPAALVQGEQLPIVGQVGPVAGMVLAKGQPPQPPVGSALLDADLQVQQLDRRRWGRGTRRHPALFLAQQDKDPILLLIRGTLQCLIPVALPARHPGGAGLTLEGIHKQP